MKKIKTNYHILLNKVSSILEGARKRTVKFIDTIMIETYLEIGHQIIEFEQSGKTRAKYGEKLLQKLSVDLVKKFGKGFSAENLRLMRKFYLIFGKSMMLTKKSDKISKTLSWKSPKSRILFRPELSWSHYCELISIEDEKMLLFYQNESINNNWSVRELKRQMNSLLYERLTLSKNKQKVTELSKKGQIIEKPEDVIKNPYILEFTGIPEKSYFKESELEQRLIDHLQDFILELGKGFTFVSRQKRITIDNEHYYIDLIFYHRILKCLILIDLKVGVLSHGDVGQMNFYLNYINDREKIEGENPPIGIILCTEGNKSKVFIKYALGSINNKIFISKYKLYLPTKKQLEEEIKKEIGKK